MVWLFAFNITRAVSSLAVLLNSIRQPFSAASFAFVRSPTAPFGFGDAFLKVVSAATGERVDRFALAVQTGPDVSARLTVFLGGSAPLIGGKAAFKVACAASSVAGIPIGGSGNAVQLVDSLTATRFLGIFG